MSVINKATITFIQNGETVNSTVLNRALNQTIDQINNFQFGGAYSAGSGISIVDNTISVNNTVTRTTGNFTINGNWTFANTVMSVGFNTTSDARLKENVSDYELGDNNQTDIIKLKQWIWAEHDAVPEQLHGVTDSGVIADDVEKVFPTCVTVREDGFKTVDYGKLAVHLILTKGA